MPFGTNLTSLAPTITISPLATVSPNTGVARDFSSAVTYTVTAQDLSTQVYNVLVTVASAPVSTPMLNSMPNMLSFGNITAGGLSSELMFTVMGMNITTSSVIVVAPAEYEVSTTTSGFSDIAYLSVFSGTVSGTIYARYKPSNTASGLNTGIVSIFPFPSAGSTFSFVTLSGTAVQPTAPLPMFIALPNMLSFGNVTLGGMSSEMMFTVMGMNLTTSSVNIHAPMGFMISTMSGSGFGSMAMLPIMGGSVTGTIFTKFMANTSAGMAMGTITVASGMEMAWVTVSGNSIAAFVSLPITIEHFNYGSTNSNLTLAGMGTWYAHSGQGSNSVQYINQSLVFGNYLGGIPLGGAATAGNATGTREDVNRGAVAASNYTNGTVYAGVLIRISDVTGAGDYPIHFVNATSGPSTGAFWNRISIRPGATGVDFGLGKNSTTFVWGADDQIPFNETVLLVSKYTFVPGATNDIAELFVFRNNMPSTEPTALVTGTTTEADLSTVAGIAIRQGSAGTSTYTIDGIVMGTSWADLYTLTGVTMSTANSITSFSIPGMLGSTISGNNISLLFPFGSVITSLSPMITISPLATVNPNTGVAQDFSTTKSYTVTSQALTTNIYSVSVSVVPASTANAINSFSIPGMVGSTISGNNITVLMPFGTVVTSLIPSIAISPLATVNPNTGVAQDFSTSITYTVTSQSLIPNVYTVSVTAATTLSTANSITGFSIPSQVGSTTISGNAIFVNVPFGTNLTSLTPTISISPLATVNPNTGVAQNFSGVVNYTVTSQAFTTNIYSVSLNVLPSVGGINANKIFISEYIEGSSNNKALEIFNGNSVDIDLSLHTISLLLYSNGSITGSNGVTLTGIFKANSTYVIANSAASAPILALSSITSTITFYNGDDALGLYYNGTLIDAFGQIGVDPGTNWGTSPTSSLNQTLRRKVSICQGDINPSDAFDPATEWDGFAIDDIAGLGSHTINCAPPSSITSIVGFTLANRQAVINGTIVNITVPSGLDISNITASGVLSAANATVSPAFSTALNYNNTVTFTVTSQSLNSIVYTVQVAFGAPLSSANSILGFNVTSNQITNIIDHNNGIVNITVPGGTYLDLIAPISVYISPYATISPSTASSRNFNSPIVFTVTAENLSTKVYTITVTSLPVALYNYALTCVGINNNEPFNTVPGNVLYYTGWTRLKGDGTLINPGDANHFAATTSAPSAGYVNSSGGINAVTSNGTSTGFGVFMITSGGYNTTNWRALKVNWGFRRTSTFTNDGGSGGTPIYPKLEWSQDGVTWNLISGYTHPSATSTWQLVNASGIPVSVQAENKPNIYFRFTLTTIGVGSGNYRFDDFLLTGTAGVSILSNENSILGFNIPGQDGATTISGTNITVLMPRGTPVTALSPSISISGLATINPISGFTKDFTSVVSYTVTAESGVQRIYNVTVISPPALSSASSVISLVFLPNPSKGLNTTVTGAITGNVITVNFPAGVTISGLVPTIVRSPNASANIADGLSPNFNAVSGQSYLQAGYTVTAENGIDNTVYSIRVRVLETFISSFLYLPNPELGLNTTVTGTIVGNVINVNLPFGVTITGLVPTFTAGANTTVSPSLGTAPTYIKLDTTYTTTYTVVDEAGGSISYTVFVKISNVSNPTTTTNEVENIFMIYPNPAENVLSISSATPTEIELVHITGTSVLSTSIEKGTQIVDISSIASGIYVVINKQTKQAYRVVIK
ncbi:MAG: lamin tail domain-containing protein [Bacteroidota bacterium]|nr:lamin tail domain-containing protein [Bacteroidota bacterium]